MPSWSEDMGQSMGQNNPAFSRQTSKVSAPATHSNAVSTQVPCSPSTWPACGGLLQLTNPPTVLSQEAVVARLPQ